MYQELVISIPPMIATFKNLPNSMFAHWNDLLKKDKEIFYPDIAELKKHDIGLHYTLEQRGVKSCYIIGLWDGNRIPLGFVIVDFCRSRKTLNQRERQQFRAVSMKICGLLMSGSRRSK